MVATKKLDLIVLMVPLFSFLFYVYHLKTSERHDVFFIYQLKNRKQIWIELIEVMRVLSPSSNPNIN